MTQFVYDALRASLLPRLPTAIDSLAMSPENQVLSIASSIARPQGRTLERRNATTVHAQIYDVLADAKVQISRVAAHLPETARRRLFSQPDSLHDIEDWEKGDQPAQSGSFTTFLRTMLLLSKAFGHYRWPSLGMSTGGQIVSSWGGSTGRLTLEFIASGRVQWSLTCHVKGDTEVRTVGIGEALMILDFLDPYDPGRWFDARR